MLTRRQLEALETYLRVLAGEILFREAAAKSSLKAVTVGSYYRTVQQARKNIRESIVTVLIGLWLGLVKPEDVRRLLDLSGLGAKELSEEGQARVIEVLRALVQKIVL